MSYIKSEPIKFMVIYIDRYDRCERIETFTCQYDMTRFCASDKVYDIINTYTLKEF